MRTGHTGVFLKLYKVIPVPNGVLGHNLVTVEQGWRPEGRSIRTVAKVKEPF
jgi:hypothetical protein